MMKAAERFAVLDQDAAPDITNPVERLAKLFDVEQPREPTSTGWAQGESANPGNTPPVPMSPEGGPSHASTNLGGVDQRSRGPTFPWTH